MPRRESSTIDVNMIGPPIVLSEALLERPKMTFERLLAGASAETGSSGAFLQRFHLTQEPAGLRLPPPLLSSP